VYLWYLFMDVAEILYISSHILDIASTAIFPFHFHTPIILAVLQLSPLTFKWLPRHVMVIIALVLRTKLNLPLHSS
jgi:hypothetical protein